MVIGNGELDGDILSLLDEAITTVITAINKSQTHNHDFHGTEHDRGGSNPAPVNALQHAAHQGLL
jgi:hypothetical protein